MTPPSHFPSLTLLGDLPQEDLERLLGLSSEEQVISGHLVVRAGERPEAIYIVLEGLLAVVHPTLGEVLAMIGPGETVAEMSFVQHLPASADVRAQENSLLLVLPVEAIDRCIEEHPAFGVRFFRAVSATLATRVRASNHRLERLRATRSDAVPAAGGAWPELFATIDGFKARLRDVDQLALKQAGRIPEEVTQEVGVGFSALVRRITETLAMTADDDERTRMGARLQAELLPYLLLSELGERMYAKPRGYAGDYLTIANLYADRPAGTGRLGPLLDRCLRDQHAGQAVRNRRGLLAEEIGAVLSAHPGTVQVTSLASGPAQELFDVYATLDEPGRLRATLVDIDLQALAHVSEHANAGLRPYLRFEHGNLVYLALGRTRLDLPPQHLVYSIGLIDYFNDKFVVNLLNFIHGLLAPGGRCILGNFHPSNPTKGLMDEVLDWTLIHRDEADMQRLFSASAFGRPCDEIRFEASGVNLFAIGQR